MNLIDAMIREAHDLDPLPASATRLAAIFASADWELSDVVDAIALDPALTSRVLRLANSAAVSGVETITSVERAVQRIGGGSILVLTIGAATQGTLSQSMPEYGVDEGVLWKHSGASALAAELAPGFCKAKVPPEAFAAALLHDVGKIVLCRHLKPEVFELLAEAEARGGVDALNAEIEVLEVHHGELGGLIAQHWKLPEIIVKGISFHHAPDACLDPRERLVCDAVCVADAAATSCGFGIGNSVSDPAAPVRARKRLRMSDAGFTKLGEALTERLEEVLAQYD